VKVKETDTRFLVRILNILTVVLMQKRVTIRKLLQIVFKPTRRILLRTGGENYDPVTSALFSG